MDRLSFKKASNETRTPKNIRRGIFSLLRRNRNKLENSSKPTETDPPQNIGVQVNDFKENANGAQPTASPSPHRSGFPTIVENSKAKPTKPTHVRLVVNEAEWFQRDRENYDTALIRHKSHGSGHLLGHNRTHSHLNSTQNKTLLKSPSKIMEPAKYLVGKAWGSNSTRSMQQLDIHGPLRIQRLAEVRKSKDLSNFGPYTSRIHKSEISYASHEDFNDPGSFFKSNNTSVYDAENQNINSRKVRAIDFHRVKPQAWIGNDRVNGNSKRVYLVKFMHSFKQNKEPIINLKYLLKSLKIHQEFSRNVQNTVSKYKKCEPLEFEYAPNYSALTSSFMLTDVQSSDPSYLTKSSILKTACKYPELKFRKDCISDINIGSIGGKFGSIILAKDRDTHEYYITKAYDKLRLAFNDQATRNKIIEIISNERMVLENLRNPFLLQSIATYTDERYLYLILDFHGGETLADLMERCGRLNLITCTFFTAELMQAIKYLHNKKIVYRALSPDTLLITEDGHILLTDFTAIKTGIDKNDKGCSTICGIDPFTAPEMHIYNKSGLSVQYGLSSDWWSLGAILCKMLTNKAPVKSVMVPGLNEELEYLYSFIPSYAPEKTIDAMKKLLNIDPNERLGSKNIEELEKHPMFSNIEMEAILSKSYTSPYSIPPQYVHSSNIMKELSELSSKSESHHNIVYEQQENSTN